MSDHDEGPEPYDPLCCSYCGCEVGCHDASVPGGGRCLRCARLKRASCSQCVQPVPRSELVEGTMRCPKCGHDQPHSHEK